MKKKSSILTLLIATLLFGGCGNNSESNNTGNTQPNSISMLTEQEAKQIALQQVPGATENNIVDFRKDMDDTMAEYEGEIHYDGMEYEFSIHAYEGTVLEWDEEPLREMVR